MGEDINVFKFLAMRAVMKAVSWIGWNPGTEGLWPAYGSASNRHDKLKYAHEVGDPLNSPLIMAAVSWLCRVIAEAPLVYTERDKRNMVTKKLARHKVIQLIKRPNDFYSGKNLLQAIGTSWMLAGEAFIIKLRDGDGEVFNLWYEPHYSIRPRWPGDQMSSPNATPQWSAKGPGSEFISFYEVKRFGQWHKVKTDDVIHLRDGIDPRNPRRGINRLASLMAEIFTDEQRAHFSATALSNLGLIPFVISPRESNNSITEKAADKLKSELEIRTRQDRGKPIVAGRAIRIDQIGVRPAEMALKEMAEIPEERVAAVIGPNASVLGFVMDKTIFSTYVEARRDAYESYLIPLHTYIAEEFTRQLLEEFVDKRGAALEYDYSEVPAMLETRAQLFEYWGRAFRDGIASRYSALVATGQQAEEEDKIFVEWISAVPTSLGEGSASFRDPAEVSQLSPSGNDTGKETPSTLPPRGQREAGGLPSRDQTVNGNQRLSPRRDRGPILGGKGKAFRSVEPSEESSTD